MARPLFQLGPRLAACASLLKEGEPVADIGTDHAYLPIWLLKKDLVPKALGADLRPGPLETARKNALRYQVADRLTLVLSDGLSRVPPEEAQQVVIAGMGGELILRIIEDAPWLKAGEHRLVLQPMTCAPLLRTGLSRLGFMIEEELAVEDMGRAYSALSARYIGAPIQADERFRYMGKLRPGTAASRQYAKKVLSGLSGTIQGLHHKEQREEVEKLEEISLQIRREFLFSEYTGQEET